MFSDRRRLWLLAAFALVAGGALLLAWWVTPSPEEPTGLGEMDWGFPPVPGVVAPPVPPPPDPGEDPAADGADDPPADPVEVAAALGEWLDTDPPAPGEADAVDRTDDGWPLATPTERWRDSAPPGEGQIVAMVVLPGGDVLAETRRDDGGVVLLRTADGAGPPRVLALDGVGEPALAAAHARAPAVSDRGPVVVAEDATGQSRVWLVDWAAGTASPQTRQGLDRPGGSGVDLDATSASGGFVAATWRGSGVAVRRVDGAAGWVVFDEGPSGVGAVDVRAVGTGARLTYTRNGRLLQLTPDRTVPDTLAASGARDPVDLQDRLLWVQSGRLAGLPAVPAEVVRTLPGRDLVRGPDGRSAAWVGADGRVRVYPDFVAIDAPVQRVTAVGVVRDGPHTLVAVAGRRGAVAEVVLLEL